MRILQVIPVFSDAFGGPVTVVRSISKELAKRHEVAVYTTTALDSRHDFDPKEEEVDGYRITYFKRTLKPLCYSGLLGQLNLSSGMMKAVKENLTRFDVVHMHSWQQFPDIMVHHYATKYGVPYILQAHGSVPKIMTKQMMKRLHDVLFGFRLLRNASKVIALNQVEAVQYRCMGVHEEKIVIIPNGIDLSEYADLPLKGSFKKQFGLKEDEKIVLCLSRIHKIKGIDILVKAFADVIKKLDDIRLVIVGPDDGYLSEIEALIKALKIEDNVLITGPLYGRDKLEAYVESDVYVLPSRYETFPMSVLEAYACAKPVICSRVLGLKDLVIDGVTGILVESGNSEQLANSILSLLNDNDESRVMGLRGKLFSEKNFSVQKVVNRLEQLYGRACAIVS
jgi:glycosyltransferase involved in cell wall biosynthesis